MKIELKPCPNCGSFNTMISRCIIGTITNRLVPYRVFCENCNYYAERAFTVRGAVKKWNRRINDAK